MHFIHLLVAAALVAVGVATEMRDPGELAFDLSEDEFEDYLDTFLAYQQAKRPRTSIADPESSCILKINGDFGQPQPLYIRDEGYLRPNGSSGEILLSIGDQVLIACTKTGNLIQHSNINSKLDVGTATCVKKDLVSASWLKGDSAFGQLTCSTNCASEAEATKATCFNKNTVLRVGYILNGVFYELYQACFDPKRLEVLYVWYQQNATNSVFQTGVNRPNWQAGSFYPGVGVDNAYTQNSQKKMVASFVGSTNADKYITGSQYLARGHYAAKSDFVYATGQRATFYFVNAAPQWQPFNAGNWNWLEQNLRSRIGDAGYNALIYTGTFGVTQLRNEKNQLVDIYLHRDAKGTLQIPVPLYFYKVAYDPSRQIGTAFISINNPYYTKEEVQKLQFCKDQCRNNPAFSWLKWKPDSVDIGYSFCCTITDFRKTVGHLPNFTDKGLLA